MCPKVIKEESSDQYENVTLHDIALLAEINRAKAIKLLSSKLGISKADAIFKLNEIKYLEN